MQILFRFNTDFICRFQCGLHYGFHLWILWISYEIHLIPYERLGESEECNLNQLFFLTSGGFHYKFHEIQHNFTKTNDFMRFQMIMKSKLDFTKSNKIQKIHRSLQDYIKSRRILLEFH